MPKAFIFTEASELGFPDSQEMNLHLQYALRTAENQKWNGCLSAVISEPVLF